MTPIGMSTQLQIRCSCGEVRGVARDIDRRRVRLRCYCVDCQCFAWFLDRPELLDRHGGTEVVQLSPARVSFHAGQERLACMRLSAKGLWRWYASCCRTPLANSMTTPPFVGLLSSAWDPELDADGRDALLGRSRARVNGPGRAAADGSMAKIDKLPLAAIAASIRVMLAGALRGEQRPSPFFELDGSPKVAPRVLEPAEREALRGRLVANVDAS
jgi:hypothetical protein